MTQISPGPRGGEVPTKEEHRLLEGETFSVNCSYKPQEHDKRSLTWCKKQENGEHCGVPLLLETESKFSVSGKEYFSSYDSNSGIITIMMSGLRVTDSGVYECGICEVPPKWGKDVLRRFHLVVSPAQTQSPMKEKQATTEVTSNNEATNRSSTSSIAPPGESSTEKKFVVLGVVLSCLFLLVLLVVGIICTRRISQKAGKGDDSETQQKKSKGSTMKQDSDEDSEDIHYATVSNRNSRELIGAKTHTPAETVEYATITKK
ncbi:trem-like transcript 4 protein [Dromiciops gliroides]|uniref:trem-like transcript 4 protein n=1 Tax=Dromiciops gliroides TaxID=33562 RepID=UPI001CC3B2F1|nr:trem-like transcript 4 protein [Dromiciops gliroides]